MKTPFSFAFWNMIIAFMISWGIWVILAHTAFKWGWLTVNDGFVITLIFTISSFLRMWLMNHIQHSLLGIRK